MAKENIVRVKEQDAIPFYLANRFGDVGGVASYSGVARGLEKSGLRVLHQSRPQPYFPLVAKRTFTAAQLQAIQSALAHPARHGGRSSGAQEHGHSGF